MTRIDRVVSLEKVSAFYPVNLRKMREEEIAEAAAIDGRSEFDHWDVYKIHRSFRARSCVKWVAWSPASMAKGTIDAYLMLRLKVGCIEIQRLCVRRQVRRRRVGSQILRAALHELRKGDFRHAAIFVAVHEQNEEGLHFFHKLGFRRVGTIHGKYPDYDYGPISRDAYWLEQRPKGET